MPQFNMTLDKRPEYPTAEQAQISVGNVISYGNINLTLRPIVKGKNGDILSSFSMVINEKYTDGTNISVVIPTVSDDGQKLNNKDAEKLYSATGRHFGKFATLRDANKYLQFLTRSENQKYRSLIQKTPDYLVGEKVWYPISDIVSPSERNLGGIIQLSDLYGDALNAFSENLISVTVNYTMDLNPEISIEIIDENYRMFESNYFVIRRDVTYRGRRYEIAEVSVGPGPGGAPSVVVKARNKAIQQMRRDKLPGSVTGGSGYEYAGNAAAKFGLQFVGQRSSKTKSTFKARNGDGEESVWDVLTRTANDNQFVVFEVDGVLVYASQEWLLWKFGSSTGPGNPPKKFVPLFFSPRVKTQALLEAWVDAESTEAFFELESWHDFSSSDNEPLAASGSCNVLMPQGGALRPGMTALCGPYPTYFLGGYLITEVTFQEGAPQPAQITFRTPEEPKNQKGLPLKPRTGTQPGILG